MQPAKSVTRVHDLIDISLYAAVMLNTEVWWRGHSIHSWQLVPSVYRGSRPPQHEGNMAIRFYQRAATRYPKCPPEGDFAGWLFLMQHYRLPTRLLDWTESILVAAYFACKENPSEDAVLWALSPYKLNDIQVGTNSIVSPNHDLARQLFRPPFTERFEPATATVAIMARELDLRMTVQLSAFTIHGSKTPMEDLPSPETFLLEFSIPASSKESIIANLFYLGVRESTLFPDLEHLAKELAELDFEEPDNPRP